MAGITRNTHKLRLNDMGFLSAPDEIDAGLWASYRYNPEGKSRVFNQAQFNFNFWKDWLYAGRKGHDVESGQLVWSYGPGHRAFSGGNVNSWMQFRNYMEAWWGIELIPEGTQRYETRGGPLMSEPTTYGAWWGGETDTRKDLQFEVEGSYYADVAKNWTLGMGLGTDWKQSSAINHEVSLGFRHRVDDTQYLETVNLSERPGGVGIGGLSYVFGKINQKTVDLTLRTNLLFSRNQSLEIYAQPFITVGDYTNAVELATPDSYDLIPYNEAGFEVAGKDFSFTAVNLNLVYRWEYRPGSTLFLVWTHSRSDYQERSFFSNPGSFSNKLDAHDLFNNEPENVFLAKITYWFAI